MSSNTYLFHLSDLLTSGLENLPDEKKTLHRNFIFSQQCSDGGFSGREGDSDLYYTGFAVRGLMITGGISQQECEHIGQYLEKFQPERLNVIDLISWLFSLIALQLSGHQLPVDILDEKKVNQIFTRLDSLRREDGGYAKSEKGALGSTYHSFLVVLLYELLGQDLPASKKLIQFIYNRQRDDGGFVEIDPMKRSGTNPTAAAAAILKIHGGLDNELCQDIHEFLTIVCNNEGGFQANTRIPFADGLSTFTGLLTAIDLQLKHLFTPSVVEKFVLNSLEFKTGGFKGAAWDEQADVEYTFYGLGILGLIWSGKLQ